MIPVKAFAAAKGRLREVMAAEERERLARALATVVVRAANQLPVFVVTADEAVRAWARALGVAAVSDPGGGLDAAVEAGVARVIEAELDIAVVAHGDLPFATDLAWIAEFHGITLVPDRHGDGTNVIAIPVRSGFRFTYGVGSFARHLAEARRLGLSLRVVRDSTLATDVDTPADLATLTAMNETRGPSW